MPTESAKNAKGQSTEKLGLAVLELMPVEATIVLGLRKQQKPKGKGPEGPKHKAWNKRYRASLGKKLKKLGINKNTIRQIVKDYIIATLETIAGSRKAMKKFIAKWLFKLIQVKKAINAEYKEEGPAPKWES